MLPVFAAYASNEIVDVILLAGEWDEIFGNLLCVYCKKLKNQWHPRYTVIIIIIRVNVFCNDHFK